jgi:hypothetical protein
MSSSSGTSNTPSSPSHGQSFVAPLSFRRDSYRKSSISSLTEGDSTEINNVLSSSDTTQDSSHSLLRRNSSLRRQLRPLPPVPPNVSRPASPASSVSSSNSATGAPRPLPLPPSSFNSERPVSGETVSTIGFAPPSPRLTCLIPNISTATLPPSTEPEAGHDSPISPVSALTDATSAFSILTPRIGESFPKKGAKKTDGGSARKHKHTSRVHASPYKLARSASRYSVTSLSSQVSVPPVPPPSELRRRNREKMAKLIRMLGDSPPKEMVFAIEQAYAELEAGSVEWEQPSRGTKTTLSRPKTAPSPVPEHPHKPNSLDSDRVRPKASLTFSSDTKLHSRSISLSGSCSDYDSIYSSKKAVSDPDAGHIALSPVTSRSTFSTTNTLSSPFSRLRPKKGRSGTSERYVVSLAGGDAERVSLRLAGSGANPNRMKPSGSYLRGAYKKDAKPVEVRVPPLPKSRISLLGSSKASLESTPEIPPPTKETKRWLRETGSTRWEVEDYENVVKSLRKL